MYWLISTNLSTITIALITTLQPRKSTPSSFSNFHFVSVITRFYLRITSCDHLTDSVSLVASCHSLLCPVGCKLLSRVYDSIVHCCSISCIATDLESILLHSQTSQSQQSTSTFFLCIILCWQPLWHVPSMMIWKKVWENCQELQCASPLHSSSRLQNEFFDSFYEVVWRVFN